MSTFQLVPGFLMHFQTNCNSEVFLKGKENKLTCVNVNGYTFKLLTLLMLDFSSSGLKTGYPYLRSHKFHKLSLILLVFSLTKDEM